MLVKVLSVVSSLQYCIGSSDRDRLLWIWKESRHKCRIFFSTLHSVWIS